MAYHAYKDGYSTLPNLKKIQLCDVFEKDRSESKKIQKEKEEALNNQKFFLEHENPSYFYDICKNFIISNYHYILKSSSYLDIAKEIDEDLIIHRLEDDKDYMSSAHVCFPSHWLPENKIGKSFEEIHLPVPMNLKNSKKIVETIINNGPFERYVWSVVYENKYNFHPRFIDKKFDKNNPSFYIKVERQITVGFPEHNFCLFLLRQYLIEEKDVDKKSLINSIEKMTPEQKIYKSLTNCEDFINYLNF